MTDYMCPLIKVLNDLPVYEKTPATVTTPGLVLCAVEIPQFIFYNLRNLWIYLSMTAADNAGNELAPEMASEQQA